MLRGDVDKLRLDIVSKTDVVCRMCQKPAIYNFNMDNINFIDMNVCHRLFCIERITGIFRIAATNKEVKNV